MIDYPNARREIEAAESALAAAVTHLDRVEAELDTDPFLGPPARMLHADIAFSLRRCKALGAHVRAHAPAGAARSGG
jgi:hypothetical protein